MAQQQPQLESVVQRMIDAGEPEENIATVIQHYKSQTITTPTAEDMLTRRVGADFSETPAKPDWKTPLIESMQSAAHPQSLSDVASLVLMNGATKMPRIVGRMISPVAQGVKKYGGAALEVGKSLLPDKAQTAIRVLEELKPSEWHSPLTVGGREARAAGAARAFNEAPLTKQMDQLPPTPAPERGRAAEPPPRNLGHETQPPPAPAAPPTTPSAGTSPSALSPADRASLQKQGYPPGVIARIEGRLLEAAGQQPPMRGTLRMAPQGEPPITPVPSHEPSPLREPRINVGAEQVGRQQGLTKEAVRQTTGPVLAEGIGEASPIFPKEALTRIVDDMRALPPGAEREAYVARATSGKAKWQVENIRRTLEHLGLLVPFAAAVRERVMQRLVPSHVTEVP